MNNVEISKGAEIALLIKEINLKIKNSLDSQLKASGLTIPQFTVIRMLLTHKQLKLTDLSEKIGLAKSTVSGIVDRLESQKLVKRVRSENDKRIVYIELTKETQHFDDSIHDIVNHYLDNMLSGATDEEVGDILRGLETLKSLLN